MHAKCIGVKSSTRRPQETAFHLNWQYIGTHQEMPLACSAQIASIFNTLFKKYYS
jgi:hypothetical protein